MAISQSIASGVVHVELTGHCPLYELHVRLATVTHPAFSSEMPWAIDCHDITTLWSSAPLRTIATEMAERCTALGPAPWSPTPTSCTCS